MKLPFLMIGTLSQYLCKGKVDIELMIEWIFLWLQECVLETSDSKKALEDTKLNAWDSMGI